MAIRDKLNTIQHKVLLAIINLHTQQVDWLFKGQNSLNWKTFFLQNWFWIYVLLLLFLLELLSFELSPNNLINFLFRLPKLTVYAKLLYLLMVSFIFFLNNNLLTNLIPYDYVTYLMMIHTLYSDWEIDRNTKLSLLYQGKTHQ